MICLQSAQPDVFEATSAQEGGALIMDRGKDRDTLMLYLDDSLILVKRSAWPPGVSGPGTGAGTSSRSSARTTGYSCCAGPI